MDEKQKEIPMIPKHQHQAEMMHASWTIRWLVIGIVIGFLCMVLQALIFVCNYTSRTDKWLNTYDALVKRVSVTEVANEENTAGNIQQLQIP